MELKKSTALLWNANFKWVRFRNRILEVHRRQYIGNQEGEKMPAANVKGSIKYDWIDGLKGIACLIVATNHIHNLFPIVNLPLAIYNGQIMVYVFVLLSIVLSSVSVFRRLDGKAPSIDCANYIVSRYICLFIPVLLVILITLCGYYFRAFDSYQPTMAITGGG